MRFRELKRTYGELIQPAWPPTVWASSGEVFTSGAQGVLSDGGDRLHQMDLRRYDGLNRVRVGADPRRAIGTLGMSHYDKGEDIMKPGRKDEVAGKVREVKGAVKEKVGKLTRRPDVEAKGKGEKLAGKVQKKIGKVKLVLGQ